MTTLKHGFTKRLLSLVLALMMVVSICVVGITSTTAAEVEVADTGATITGGTVLYLDPTAWDPSSAWFAAYFYNSSGNAWAKCNVFDGSIYSVTAPDGSWTTVIFCRMNPAYSTLSWDYKWNQTGNLTWDGSNSLFTINTSSSWNGQTSGWSAYTPPVEEISEKFWVDIDGDPTTTIDNIYPDYYNGTYTLYLPSSADLSNLIFGTDAESLIVNDTSVTADTPVAVAITTGTDNTLGGNFDGFDLEVYQSANVPAMYTSTKEAIPQGIGYDDGDGVPHKDDYSSKGTIKIVEADGKEMLTESELSKIKGRGNSSWKASVQLIGKYAFNITLGSKKNLLDSGKTKKYCLVSYNADEARMRNMVIYDLAKAIGVEYVANFQPVDLYNNGYYIGSYLLTDKVEIGDPLVGIVNLDDINEMLFTDEDAESFGNNYYLYDDDSLMERAYQNGTSIDDNTTPGFYKYISNLEEPDPSEYAESGFLLEFELDERFADEISGFISTKGQQIVCKYPEYATKNEIEFISGVWNAAEAVIYDTSATYEDLDLVIDVESFAKMYLIQELTKNLDACCTSYYVYYDGGKLHAGVAWDYDWTLGQYSTDLSQRLLSTSVFSDHMDGTPSNYGGWFVNSKEIYVESKHNSTTLNAQAQLCQNDNFWNVVKAEWNELFYSAASGITAQSGPLTDVSALEGKILEYYNTVHASTLMDEAKWNIIADDPMVSWGSKDTGDTHDDATVALSNWIYNRLTWMNGYLDSADYTIAKPTLTVDEESYFVNDTVTLTAKCNTSGNLTYTFYDSEGTELGSVESDTGSAEYTYTASVAGTDTYSVVVSSANTSDITEEVSADVLVENYSIEITSVIAPESVLYNDKFDIRGTSSLDDLFDVVYDLYYIDSDDNEIPFNSKAVEGDNGLFADICYDSSAINQTGRFKLVASVTINDVTYSDYEYIDIEILDYSLTATLTAPETAEAGLDLTLVAKASFNAESEFTYEFYNADDDTLIGTGTSGILKISVSEADVDNTLSYYVIARATVTDYFGVVTPYEFKTEPVSVLIIPVQEVYYVTINFKSSDTVAYKPYITTTGAVNDAKETEMTRTTFIGYNETMTASYSWYSYELQISKASPSVYIDIVGSRYAFEGEITLNVTESGDIYLGAENLNFTPGNKLVDLTNDENRNFAASAVNMIYDAGIDDALLANISANVTLRSVGDADGDGKVTIKDVTLIQKYLVDTVTLGTVDRNVSDVNGDGIITIKDATAIQKKLVAIL